MSKYRGPPRARDRPPGTYGRPQQNTESHYSRGGPSYQVPPTSHGRSCESHVFDDSFMSGMMGGMDDDFPWSHGAFSGPPPPQPFADHSPFPNAGTAFSQAQQGRPSRQHGSAYLHPGTSAAWAYHLDSSHQQGDRFPLYASTGRQSHQQGPIHAPAHAPWGAVHSNPTAPYASADNQASGVYSSGGFYSQHTQSEPREDVEDDDGEQADEDGEVEDIVREFPPPNASTPPRSSGHQRSTLFDQTSEWGRPDMRSGPEELADLADLAHLAHLAVELASIRTGVAGWPSQFTSNARSRAPTGHAQGTEFGTSFASSRDGNWTGDMAYERHRWQGPTGFGTEVQDSGDDHGCIFMEVHYYR